ncbi:MAG: hypothetical protein DDT31_01224 [Syntrophomonadaceae bacterium]|nr:hypothetical protein [Bacillota bacterium]
MNIYVNSELRIAVKNKNKGESPLTTPLHKIIAFLNEAISYAIKKVQSCFLSLLLGKLKILKNIQTNFRSKQKGFSYEHKRQVCFGYCQRISRQHG